VRHPKGYFALKKLKCHDEETFEMELASLLYTLDIHNRYGEGSRQRPHLIEVLASFEVTGRTTEGMEYKTYYLLFDWAEGDLSNFWERHVCLVGKKEHSLWIARQFYGLSVALECIHNERNALKQAVSDQNLYGRHGDISPGNILWMLSDQAPGHMALADFGLGKLHTKLTKSMSYAATAARTATYRSPEFDLPREIGILSAASDIFSLGCVFLEYITWYLLGIDSVETEFPELRMELDVHKFESDTFFSIIQDPISGQPKPSLKPKVVNWIKKLQNHEDCSNFISQLLDLIGEKMLHPERDQRIRSNLLTKKMGAMLKTCIDDEAYYLRRKSSE
jgi:serine/threonine protein kinase